MDLYFYLFQCKKSRLFLLKTAFVTSIGSAGHPDHTAHHSQFAREGIRNKIPDLFSSFWDTFSTNHCFAVSSKPSLRYFPGGFGSLQFSAMKCSILDQIFGDVAPVSTKLSLFSDSWWCLEQAAQRGCGYPIPGRVQGQAGCSLEPSGTVEGSRGKEWNKMSFKIHSQPDHSMTV